MRETLSSSDARFGPYFPPDCLQAVRVRARFACVRARDAK
nr:MAG TPA: hypothetical protein [Microviridae sp.]